MTITMDQPRSRRLTEQTAADAYRPANVRPKHYRGRRRSPGLLGTMGRELAGTNPATLLAAAAGALWITAVILADQMGIVGDVLAWRPW